ncbi:MAG TPA: hypothetical protein EYM33_08805 [Pseudomonadales bacterium]|nr:hypothetical protein [Pseudomonadales bacterium]
MIKQILRSCGRQTADHALASVATVIVALACTIACAEDSRLLKTLRGHKTWVQSVAISPDGKWIVSGSDDQTLRVWDLKTGNSRTLRKYDSAVTAVAFSRDGKCIAGGTYDGELQVCDSQSGKVLLQLTGHDDSITTVLFDPTGQYIASGSCDDTLVIWDASDGVELLTFEQGNEYDVTTAAFSPDGKRLVTGDGENELKVWDTENGEEVMTLTGHTATVTSAAYSPDGKHIVSASWDKSLRLWNAATGKAEKTFRGHTADITSVLFGANGRQIVSASDDKTARIWDIQSGKLASTLTGHRHGILCLAISTDGRFLVSGSKTTIRVWKLVCAEDTVSEEEAWELGWPTMQGPYGNFQVPRTGAKLVDDLSKAKLVWESEDKDFGRAKHTTGAFKAKSPAGRAQKMLDILGPNPKATPGGWAAPIIAEGKLFVTTFKPAGKLYDVQSPAYDDESKKNPTAVKAYLEANDMLIALDAKTGKTLWKASEPGGFVWGVGKRNGFQVAPVYYQGVVYSMGTTGRLFANSAKDGKKLWQTEPEAKMVEEREKHLAKSQLLQVSARYGWQQSLVLAGGTLIVPRHGALLGLEPTTGKKRWELPKIISRWATPTVWKHDGDEYLLCATGGKPGQGQLRLIDPAAGKVLWTVDGLHATQFNLAPSRDYVLVNVGSSIMKEGANGSAPQNADGDAPFGLLGAYKITPKGAQRAWTLPDKPHFLIPTWNDSVARPRAVIRNGLVYHTTEGPDKKIDRRFIVAREDTGEVLVDEPRINDFWFQLIEDKLLYCRDWSHGKSASWYLYSADPKNFKQLSGPWSTKQPLTTSYQVLMEPPVIAGHIFLRTETGTVVCYDLTEK